MMRRPTQRRRPEGFPRGFGGFCGVWVRKTEAFSLLELLVVVLIMLLLTTLYWGGRSDKGARQKQAACLNNLQKLFIAMEIYSNEQNGKFPELAGASTSEEALALLVPKYNADLSLFICPGSKDLPLSAGQPLRGSRISYAYYMGRRATDARAVLMSDQQVDSRPKAVGQDVFSNTGKPPGNNHDKSGGNFLFCDGQAEAGPVRAPFPILLTQGVTLLNPKSQPR